MLESLIAVLEIAMILMCIVALFLLIMIKRRVWGEYSLNDQEIMFFIYKMTYSRNFRILLLLSLVLIPLSAIFLTGENGFEWHFFAILEVAFIFLYVVHREWQKIINRPLYSEPVTQKESILQKCIVSPRNKVFWLYIGFFSLIVLLSINVIYHFSNLFSPNPDVEKELIIIIISFSGIGVLVGLLSILPNLGDFIIRIKQKRNLKE